jgi:hypothetical protein
MARKVTPDSEWENTPGNEFGGAPSGSWTFITPATIVTFVVAGIGVAIVSFTLGTLLFAAVYGLFLFLSFLAYALEARNVYSPVAFIGVAGKKRAVAFGVCVGAIWFVLMGLLGKFVNFSLRPASMFAPLSMTGIALSVLAVGLIVPIIEEKLFRGAILPTITEKGGVFPAVVLTGVIFGGAHMIFGGSLSLAVSAAVFGMVLNMFTLRNQDLSLAIGGHVTYNTLCVLAALLVA